ncbi:glycosyltransferase family 2 protein [Iningainema tapete]|uniref:Glycosyltransferase family 2 protein n=1 Tax=Iningainema tapete BLCC-T55 TaxID=2748662 RepID=A0A8J7BWB3_9CYAN|nr:glycosyltransferase family 2 protein [Iningainema tapete BLCC-T55]
MFLRLDKEYLEALNYVPKFLTDIDKYYLDYQQWVEKNRLTEQDIADCREEIASMHIHPKFSVIIPLYNVEGKWLEKAIESVLNQIYPVWELCIADDASTEPHIRSILNHYSQVDQRIKVVFRTENGNISAASNSALKLATGDYIALLDHDDELAINALFENAKLINQHPNADFIYSDEDKIDTQGNFSAPFFKPNWSPEYFYSCMYTCHLGVYRTSLIHKIGGFRSEYDGAQDYDLVLRVIEEARNIFHIPKILYHWRTISTSVATGDAQAKPWAHTAARKALQAMIERSSYPGRVEETQLPGFYRVRRDIVGQPLISIIIPSAGKRIFTPLGEVCLLENCIRSINKLSTYRNYEIIVVDGYDIPESTLEAISNDKSLRAYASPDVQLVRTKEPFNFSMRINIGIPKARGEFLLLLNDDTQVITPDWIESMLELAQQKEIGAVGAKLLFPDRKVQHVGVVINEGNPGHVFYGYDGEGLGYYNSNITIKNYLAVTGACLMMRLDLFQQLGGLDEEFPLNYNDVDLCLKAHQAGYRNVVTPFAQLVHYESASRSRGVQPEELSKFKEKWHIYLKTLGGDPYLPQIT